jgi:hypothetical protein
MAYLVVGVVGLGFMLGAFGMMLADMFISIYKQIKKL